MSLEVEFDDPEYVGSILDLLCIIVVSLSGILVNWKFLRNLREDDKNRGPNSNGILIRDVMETQTKTLMVAWPIMSIFFWVLREDVEFPAWTHYSFCYVKLVTHTFRIYFAFNSLVVAVMRYTVIVHQDSVFLFGIEKVKRLFYYGSIITPVMISILKECTLPIFWRGKAYSICIDSYGNMTNTGENMSGNFSSPIYFFVNQYVSTEITYYIGILVKISLWVILGNIVEGVLYWRTFAYIRR